MKVLIIGLRKEHREKLRQIYKDMCINTLSDGEKHHRAVNNANEYDTIISLTKFTNHSTHKNYSKHKGYYMTSGSYSSVKKILGELVC